MFLGGDHEGYSKSMTCCYLESGGSPVGDGRGSWAALFPHMVSA